MKKIIILFLLSCFTTVSLFAESSILVKGQLAGPTENEPLPFATISIAKETSPDAAFKKLAADDKGNFNITLPEGKYIFTFQFVGLKSLKKIIEISTTSKIDLGKIVLSENSTQLDEISVVAQKPLVKVETDKLTYNAKDDPESSTSNVLDLLRKVPMVTVDGEDKIQLKGSTNFKIYLNGKPSNMITNNPSQVLKSMPASSIKNIEVITEPGAKYDAEGVGGIINIITDKRVDDGYSGSAGANTDIRGGYGANGYLSLKYGKFGFTGNTSYYHFNQPQAESTYQRKEFEPLSTNSLTQNGTNKVNGGGLYWSGALSYEPDTLNLFNFSASRYGGSYSVNTPQDALSEGTRNYSYHAESTSKTEYGGMNLSGDYQHNFKKKGEMLTVSYRYEENPNNSNFDNIFTDVKGNYFYPNGYRQKSINKASGKEHTTQIDYELPFSSKHTLETGLKYIFRKNYSTSDNTFFDVNDETWKDDSTQKNDLNHHQNIMSGYLNYSFKTGKFGLNAGFRGEYTFQKIHFMNAQDTIINNNFFDPVPSVTVSYQLGMTKTLRVGYNMRISRPGIWYLNPYINNQNPTNIYYGNPKLDAEHTHNFNINFGTFTPKINLNTTLSYSLTNNAITSYSFVKDGVTHNTQANIGKNQNVGLNLFGSWTPNLKIRWFVNANTNYTDIRSTDETQLKNNGFSGQIFSGLTLTLPKDLRLGANGGIFSGNIQLQTTQSSFYFYSFNVMKSFFNKKLDINLSTVNPFAASVKFKSTTKGEGFTQETTYLEPIRNVRLSATFRFGNLKTSIKKVQKSISNDDLKAGGSNSQPSTRDAGVSN